MNAKYYRFLFQNVEQGVCHTGSILDTYENKAYNFIFISGLKESYQSCQDDAQRMKEVERFNLIVLADFSVFSIGKLMRVLNSSKVDKVIMPKYSINDCKELALKGEEEGTLTEEENRFLCDPYAFLNSKGVQEIAEIEKNTEFLCNDWRFIISAFGNGIDRSLIMYHGSYHMDKETDDCVMMVKCLSKLESCSVCVDPERIYCGMKCVLYNDFDICKKHNGKQAEEYTDGTLLLGTVDLKKNLKEIQTLLGDVWRKIRFVAVPNGASNKQWNKDLLDIGSEGYKQYFIIPQSDCKNADTIRDISMSSPYKQLIATSTEYGLCCSGFFKHYEDN